MDLHVVKFDSPRGHYTAETCIFWCFDARFAKAYNNFIAERGFDELKIDAVKGAGGAQPLAGGAGADRDVAESQLSKSIKLHHTERIILMVHIDCGGYGGSKAFDSDHKKEWDHHVAELDKAAHFVNEKFPEIKIIECWIADFDGLHKIA
jgi:carbonic anhydrase